MPGASEICKAYIPAILGTAAIICGTASNLYCGTVSFHKMDGVVGSGSDAILDVSPFYYRTKSVVEFSDELFVVTHCRNYKYLDVELGFDYEMDSRTKTVRAFSIMTPLIGGLGLIFAYVVPCSQPLNLSQWKVLFPIFLIACLFQGITLLILSSSICNDNPVIQYMESQFPEIAETFPTECEKGTGYILNIVSVVCWFLAAISAQVIPPPILENGGAAPVQSQTVTYQQNPDGTVQETNVTIVKGKDIASADATPLPETAMK